VFCAGQTVRGLPEVLTFSGSCSSLVTLFPSRAPFSLFVRVFVRLRATPSLFSFQHMTEVLFELEILQELVLRACRWLRLLAPMYNFR
jgi:hypothetical protein